MDHDEPEIIKKSRELMDKIDLADPEGGFRAHEEAFMDANLDEFFGENSSGDPARAEWLIEKATEIVEAELREGESEEDLLQRRDSVESLRVQRALDVLLAAGCLGIDEDEDEPE